MTWAGFCYLFSSCSVCAINSSAFSFTNLCIPPSAVDQISTFLTMPWNSKSYLSLSDIHSNY